MCKNIHGQYSSSSGYLSSQTSPSSMYPAVKKMHIILIAPGNLTSTEIIPV